MTERTDTGLGHIRLSDSEFILEDWVHDIRGLDVYDKGGEEIGTVEGLYVDEEVRKARFLDVGAGGFLGLGEKNFLVPVEAVREVNENGVVVGQSREKVAGSPPSTRMLCTRLPTSETSTTTTATPAAGVTRTRERGLGAYRI
jgi:sporulation protein YlmC with PRC-barrel domain